MRKKVTILTAAIAMALATALPASAAGNGYGKTINESCLGASYGQLVSTAIQSGHADKASGAKTFVEAGLLAAHEGALC